MNRLRFSFRFFKNPCAGATAMLIMIISSMQFQWFVINEFLNCVFLLKLSVPRVLSLLSVLSSNEAFFALSQSSFPVMRA